MKAVVDKEECIGCGQCTEVCPVVCPIGGITIENEIAVVSEACIGCGTCKDVCPTEAISLK